MSRLLLPLSFAFACIGSGVGYFIASLQDSTPTTPFELNFETTDFVVCGAIIGLISGLIFCCCLIQAVPNASKRRRWTFSISTMLIFTAVVACFVRSPRGTLAAIIALPFAATLGVAIAAGLLCPIIAAVRLLRRQRAMRERG